MKSISGDNDARRGNFEDFLQKFCVLMVRSKIDVAIELFEWTEEEEHYLTELSWKSVYASGTLKIGNEGM